MLFSFSSFFFSCFCFFIFTVFSSFFNDKFGQFGLSTQALGWFKAKWDEYTLKSWIDDKRFRSDLIKRIQEQMKKKNLV